jgi:hypothetical protein
LLLFGISHSYARRYLGFNAMNHVPMYVPGSSASSSNAVLVCVLGWGGCTRRQLRRLLDFYSSHGIPTVSWINPMYDYLFGVDMKRVERVLDLLLLQRSTFNRIVIHLHSNNGTLVWSHMADEMRTNPRYGSLLPSVKGVILDSAPFAHLTTESDWLLASAVGTSRAGVSIILNRAQYVHWFWSPLLSYYLFLRSAYRRYFSTDTLASTDKIREFLNRTPVQIAENYLYSHADRLIPSHRIGSLNFALLIGLHLNAVFCYFDA